MEWPAVRSADTVSQPGRADVDADTDQNTDDHADEYADAIAADGNANEHTDIHAGTADVDTHTNSISAAARGNLPHEDWSGSTFYHTSHGTV